MGEFAITPERGPHDQIVSATPILHNTVNQHTQDALSLSSTIIQSPTSTQLLVGRNLTALPRGILETHWTGSANLIVHPHPVGDYANYLYEQCRLNLHFSRFDV
ncbi:hypothetical protein [Stenomitos frigidus]|uniref:hypothetical protein n=1 Tax=Stenomitos frigidus TaxID=1886765 RepID=UPI0011B224C9|nr:hypothetical protein [Stenomitos frigidus]